MAGALTIADGKIASMQTFHAAFYAGRMPLWISRS
jgi:hypothetical protein